MPFYITFFLDFKEVYFVKQFTSLIIIQILLGLSSFHTKQQVDYSYTEIQITKKNVLCDRSCLRRKYQHNLSVHPNQSDTSSARQTRPFQSASTWWPYFFIFLVLVWRTEFYIVQSEVTGWWRCRSLITFHFHSLCVILAISGTVKLEQNSARHAQGKKLEPKTLYIHDCCKKKQLLNQSVYLLSQMC